MNRLLSTPFGLVMVAVVALDASDAALLLCGIGVVAVLAGNMFRFCATLAVVAAAAAVLLGDVPPMLAALCGLAATAYLVLRHTTAAGAPTLAAALGFTVAGLAALTVPLQVPWIPLLAPLAVLAIVVLATRPFWVDGG